MIKSNPNSAKSQASATFERLLNRLALSPGQCNQEQASTPQAVAMPICWKLPGREVANV